MSSQSFDGKRWKPSVPLPYYHPIPAWFHHARYGCGECGWHGYGFWTIKSYEKHYRETHLGDRPSGGLRSLVKLFQQGD